ncbi:hypothetical protein O181_071838, partial [Austropuccinia psidii MF-1]|nr:hypothetical protein [Austropuccinia psidii MF-1]
VKTVIKDLLGWLFGHLSSHFSYCISSLHFHSSWRNLILYFYLLYSFGVFQLYIKLPQVFIFKFSLLFILFHFYPEIVPIQHSPPARQTRSQARTQAFLTPTPSAPLDGTLAVSQLRAHLDRGPNVEGEAPSRKERRVPRRSSSFSGVVGGFPGTARTISRGPGEYGEEGEENCVEEAGSDGTEGVPSPVGASQGTEGPTVAQSNQPVSHQSQPSLLAIMQQMTQIMANLQAASSSEASRPPAFKTQSIKAPECFNGTQPFKDISFIQSCQLNFHNDAENFSQDRKKILYATLFLIGRASKLI